MKKLGGSIVTQKKLSVIIALNRPYGSRYIYELRLTQFFLMEYLFFGNVLLSRKCKSQELINLSVWLHI